MINFKQFMFDKSLRQHDLASILGESQSVISLFVNGKRLPMKKHIDILIKHFGADVIEQYSISEEEFRNRNAVSVPATIIPAEVVEEVEEDIREKVTAELEKASSIPIVSKSISAKSGVDVKAYVRKHEDDLERINPSQKVSHANYAITLTDMSLAPLFLPGDNIFFMTLPDMDVLVDGKLYYLCLENKPPIIRKVKMEGNKLRLVAENSDFGDIIVSKREVISVASYVGMMRLNYNDYHTKIDTIRKQKDEQIKEIIEHQGKLIGEITKFSEREDRLISMIKNKFNQ